MELDHDQILESNMTTCKLCGITSGFVKSHIIPQAFFRELREGNVSPLLVSDKEGHFPKRAPIGVYDHRLLCARCEKDFQKYDDYGTDVLLARFRENFRPLHRCGSVVGYDSTSVDKLRLLDFLVSVLWRASVSTQPFFKAVRLGAFENDVRSEMLVAGGQAPIVFDAVLSRWMDDDDKILPTTGLLSPHREKWPGVNAYRLNFGKITAYIRVDQRPFGEVFKRFSLRSPGSCVIVNRRFALSKELTAMRSTAMKSELNRMSFKAGTVHSS